VPFEGEQFLPLRHTPHLDAVVLAPRGQEATVGAEGEGVNPLGLLGQREDDLRRGRLPQPNPPTLRQGEVTAVPAEGQTPAAVVNEPPPFAGSVPDSEDAVASE